MDASTGHNSARVEAPGPRKLEGFHTAWGPDSPAGPSTLLPAPIDDGSCPSSSTAPVENPFLGVGSLDPDSAYAVPRAAPRTAPRDGRKLPSPFKQACRSPENPFINYDEPYTANDYRPRRFAEASLWPRTKSSPNVRLLPANNELFRGGHCPPKVIGNAEGDPDDGIFFRRRPLNLGDYSPRRRPSPLFVDKPKTLLFNLNEAAVLKHQKFVNDMRNDEVRMYRERAAAHSPDMEAMGMSHGPLLDTTNGSPPRPQRWLYLPELMPSGRSRETTTETKPEEHGSNDQPQGVTQAELNQIDRIDPGLDMVNANHSYTPLVPIANNSLFADITTNLLSHGNDHAIPEQATGETHAASYPTTVNALARPLDVNALTARLAALAIAPGPSSPASSYTSIAAVVGPQDAITSEDLAALPGFQDQTDHTPTADRFVRSMADVRWEIQQGEDRAFAVSRHDSMVAAGPGTASDSGIDVTPVAQTGQASARGALRGCSKGCDWHQACGEQPVPRFCKGLNTTPPRRRWS